MDREDKISAKVQRDFGVEADSYSSYGMLQIQHWDRWIEL